MELKELIIELASIMSVTGYEDSGSETLKAIADKYFDGYFCDNVKNQILVKKCGKENAPVIIIDTHFDEIGMYVSEIKDSGFLKVTNIGGLDTRIMQASDVVIYGEKKLHGIVASTPPHLSGEKDREKLPKVGDLLIDTGYTKEELDGLVRIGTPVGFYPKYTELLNSHIAGKGFDDKACAACAVKALAEIDRDKLAGDVYLLLSAHEETDRLGGVVCGTYEIKPDYAMVVDVNLGKTPDTKSYETVDMGGGAALTLSAVTDRRLTKMTAELCRKKEIKYQRIVSASSTGTNATALSLVRGGVPVVDVGLPLKSMHTYNEVLDLADAEEMTKLIAAFVCDENIAEVFGNV